MAEDQPAPTSPEPARTSVVAGIAQRIAIFGGLSIVVGIGMAQAGVPPMLGFMVFVAGGLFGGLAAFTLGAIGFVLTRGGQDPLGRKNAIMGMLAGIGLFAIVMVPSLRAGDLPPINDITTDLADPPSFAAGPDAPDYGGRDMSYPAEFVPQVREAYPDLKPIETTLDPAAAYTKAIETAESIGWFITYKDPKDGVFDATERTALFRFVDDVAVRVRATPTGSQIDIRSKSRDGRGDLGANANRIRRFVAAYEN